MRIILKYQPHETNDLRGKDRKKKRFGRKIPLGYAYAILSCYNTEYMKYNKNNPINILKNLNQFKTCVHLHQTKREKYTLKWDIFCPKMGEYIRLNELKYKYFKQIENNIVYV